jgi:hypothetical protein
MKITDDIETCFRYWLRVEWEPDLFSEQRREGTIVWVMLNPSTASAKDGLDPTMRRVVDFSRREGFSSCEVVNLFAYRSADPQILLESKAPVGARNDDVILKTAIHAAAVVVAWGSVSGAKLRQLVLTRVSEVKRLLYYCELQCLGTAANGSPRHPLYVTGQMPLVPWRWP